MVLHIGPAAASVATFSRAAFFAARTEQLAWNQVAALGVTAYYAGHKLGSLQDVAIIIELHNGEILGAEDAIEFAKTIEQLRNNRTKIRRLVIKSHGNSMQMVDENNRDILYLESNGEITTYENQQLLNFHTSNALKQITDSRTEIDLNGCANAPLADALAKALNNGAVVEGNTTFSVSWFTSAESHGRKGRYTYVNGEASVVYFFE